MKKKYMVPSRTRIINALATDSLMELGRAQGKSCKWEASRNLDYNDIRGYQVMKVMLGAIDCEGKNNSISHQRRNPDESFHNVKIRKVH